MTDLSPHIPFVTFVTNIRYACCLGCVHCVSCLGCPWRWRWAEWKLTKWTVVHGRHIKSNMYGFSESEDLPSRHDDNPCFKTVFQFTWVVVEFPLNLWICCNESDLFPPSKRLHWQIVGVLKVHSNLCLVAFGGSGRGALTDELLGRKRHRRPVRRSLISSCCYFGLRAPSYCTSHRWLALPPSSSPCSYVHWAVPNGHPPSSGCASSQDEAGCQKLGDRGTGGRR